jgi:hypothetical protein
LESVVEAVAGVVGERSWFRIAENIDGLFRGVYYDPAVLALRQMIFDFGSERRVNALIEVIGKLAQDFRALRFHDASPCWK